MGAQCGVEDTDVLEHEMDYKHSEGLGGHRRGFGSMSWGAQKGVGSLKNISKNSVGQRA